MAEVVFNVNKHKSSIQQEKLRKCVYEKLLDIPDTKRQA